MADRLHQPEGLHQGSDPWRTPALLRRPRYWSTTFGQWVNGYGVTRLASELGRLGSPVTSHAIHEWLAGRCAPNPVRAMAITQIAEGKLGLEDIYRHRSEVGKENSGRS